MFGSIGPSELIIINKIIPTKIKSTVGVIKYYQHRAYAIHNEFTDDRN